MQAFLFLGNISISNSHHLSPTDGLSQSTIRAIHQDTFGFMWIGTYDGLNKYDGKKNTVYKFDDQNPLSLPGNQINDLHEDQSYRLWITTAGGLCYLDRDGRPLYQGITRRTIS